MTTLAPELAVSAARRITNAARNLVTDALSIERHLMTGNLLVAGKIADGLVHPTGDIERARGELKRALFSREGTEP